MTTKTTPDKGKKLEKALNQSALDEIKQISKERQQEETRKALKLAPLPAMRIIKKAKITSGDTLEVEYSISGDTISIKCKAIVHDDLKAAFEDLVPHFAMLCDLKEVKKLAAFYEDTVIQGRQNLRVSCISLGGGEPATGVILTGIKQINGNKQIVINSPFTDFDSENEPYPFSGYLAKSIIKVKEEVVAYLDGKQAEDPQQVLELEETDEDLS